MGRRTVPVPVWEAWLRDAMSRSCPTCSRPAYSRCVRGDGVSMKMDPCAARGQHNNGVRLYPPWMWSEGTGS